MSDEYTPTTEQVRDGYVLRGWADEPEIVGEKGWEAQDRLGAGFDRWLAAHDAEIRRDQIERDATIARTTPIWIGDIDHEQEVIAEAIEAQLAESEATHA